MTQIAVAGRPEPTVRGFTLIELLVVIAMVAVLIGLTLVAVQGSRAAAARAGCANQLRQVGLGLQAHQSAFGIYPPRQPHPGNALGSSCSFEGIGWQVFLLPFVEQRPLWDQTEAAFQRNVDPLSAPHQAIRQTVVPTYLCPADGRLGAPQVDALGGTGGFSSYVGMIGPDALFSRDRGVAPAAVSDGLSQTIMVGERPPPASFRQGWWYTTHPFQAGPPPSVNDIEVPPAFGSNQIDGGPACAGPESTWPGFEGRRFQVYAPGSLSDECARLHYWSLHVGGAHFLFADGSVRFLPYSASRQLLDLATISGGEAAAPE